MKRSRATNFTEAEILLLLSVVEQFPIIDNKRTDGATAKEKQLAWEKLTIIYNSRTRFSPRSADNLMRCYKNQKVKVKKMHSNAKMAIAAPLLLNAMEEHGQDWLQVSQATNVSSAECQLTFNQLVTEAKREESAHKRELNQTGGGPAPQPSCSSVIYDKVKTLIGPSLDGINTMYGGDAEFMREQHALSDTPIYPIEQLENENNGGSDSTKRLNIMKKKVDPSLDSAKKGKKNNVSLVFHELAVEKKDLVKSQKTLLDLEIQHQKMQIDLMQEKIEHERKKNKMELDFLSQKYELELNFLRNKCKQT